MEVIEEDTYYRITAGRMKKIVLESLSDCSKKANLNGYKAFHAL